MAETFWEAFEESDVALILLLSFSHNKIDELTSSLLRLVIPFWSFTSSSKGVWAFILNILSVNLNPNNDDDNDASQ